METIWFFGENPILQISGIKADWLQFIYDILLTAVGSILIWKATSYVDEQKRIRQMFEEEMQDLSRYLDALQKLIELYPTRKCDVEIGQLISLSPRRESVDYLEEGYEVLWDLSRKESSIQQALLNGHVGEDECKKYASDVFRIRNRVLRLKLPKGRLKSHRIERLDRQIKRMADFYDK